MDNLYELIYMSHMCDDYAQKTLFHFYQHMTMYILSGLLASCPQLAFYYEDIVQETAAAMMRATDAYREDRNATPRTFAAVVIRRRIMNKLRYYRSHEYANMWRSVPLENIMEEYSDVFRCTDTLENPEYYTDFYLAIDRLRTMLASLSDNDRIILKCWTQGLSCREGARETGMTVRSFEGRLGRLKKRIKRAVFTED